MATSNHIKTLPVSLNETTLETNIVSEIAALFNAPFCFSLPWRLRNLWDVPYINLNAFRNRKTRLVRLTPIEENMGGGWDSGVYVPVGNTDHRAFFIQFKRGTHSEGNNISQSIFNIARADPNRHAEFKFNDNTGNNQHQNLRILANHLQNEGKGSKCVMYGFPRITRLEDFFGLKEDLLLHTSFLTIDEMDQQAIRAGSNLYDGRHHHFRTCYQEEKKREIASTTFQLEGKGENENILFEIFLVKMAHLKNELMQTGVRARYINNELLLTLADYLQINPYESGSAKFLDDRPFRPAYFEYFSALTKERINSIPPILRPTESYDNLYSWREKLFERIATFFHEQSSKKIDVIHDIPRDYTFNIQNEKIFDLEPELKEEVSLLIF